MTFGAFIVNFEQILHIVLAFLLLTSNMLAGYVIMLISTEILIGYLCF